MIRIKSVGAVLVAMIALSATAAVGASAETYPAYLTGSGLITTGHHIAYLALTASTFRFRVRKDYSVRCGHLNATGTLLPAGLSTASVHFSECAVYKVDSNEEELADPNCTVESLSAHNLGLVQLNPVRGLLVFTGTKTEAEKLEGLVGDLFTPETGTTFVTLVYAGTCPPGLPTGVSTITGSVIALASGVNQMNVNNSLEFIENPPKQGYRVETDGTIKEEVTAKGLKVFGTNLGELLGTSAGGMLEDEEEWGVVT